MNVNFFYEYKEKKNEEERERERERGRKSKEEREKERCENCEDNLYSLKKVTLEYKVKWTIGLQGDT